VVNITVHINFVFEVIAVRLPSMLLPLASLSLWVTAIPQHSLNQLSLSGCSLSALSFNCKSQIQRLIC